MLLTLIIAAAILQSLIALFVFLNNPKSKTNIFFALLSGTLIMWTLLTFINNQNPISPSTLPLVRLTMFFVVLQNTASYLFARSYPSEILSISKKWGVAYFSLSLIAAIATLSPALFIAVEQKGVALNPIPGPAMPIFVIHAFTSVVGGLKHLFRKRKITKGKVSKQQLRLVLFGFVILGIVIPFLNFGLTLSLQTSLFTNTTPISAVIFTSIIAYAIVSQKLFDIRAAVTRSVGYVLALAFIGFIYGITIFGIFSGLGLSHASNRVQYTLFIGLALLTAIIFPTIKRFFSEITTKLFYQDAYKSEEFLNNINKLLVGQLQLELLLKGITQQIEETLKTSYCVFIIRETAYEPVRVVGTEKHQFNEEKIALLRKLAPHAHRRVLVTDELGEYKDQLESLFHSLDIAVLMRLVSNTAIDSEGMGYLVIGPKKNGSIYSSQDNQVLDILANEMVIAIENGLRFEEIEKFNITLQEKIEDATGQLKRSNQKLKILDETKDDFISMASHQLRTPLTSVKGYLSMVLEGDAGEISDMQRKLLDQAFVSSQRMVYLIADLLNLSRLKTGKFVIDAVPTNLAKVIEDEVGQLKAGAASRNLTLTYEQPKDFPTFMLDETKLRQVIMNFTDNAIYYTPAGGKIDLQLEDTGKTIEFRVVDNGIGIPKKEQPHLFTKFFRAGNAKKARPDGTGLGLFMAKKVIVAQGGSLIFKSQEGEGSTFGFAFDKSKLEQPAPTEEKPLDI